MRRIEIPYLVYNLSASVWCMASPSPESRYLQLYSKTPWQTFRTDLSLKI